MTWKQWWWLSQVAFGPPGQTGAIGGRDRLLRWSWWLDFWNNRMSVEGRGQGSVTVKVHKTIPLQSRWSYRKISLILYLHFLGNKEDKMEFFKRLWFQRIENVSVPLFAAQMRYFEVVDWEVGRESTFEHSANLNKYLYAEHLFWWYMVEQLSWSAVIMNSLVMLICFKGLRLILG